MKRRRTLNKYAIRLWKFGIRFLNSLYISLHHPLIFPSSRHIMSNLSKGAVYGLSLQSFHNARLPMPSKCTFDHFPSCELLTPKLLTMLYISSRFGRSSAETQVQDFTTASFGDGTTHCTELVIGTFAYMIPFIRQPSS